MKHCKMNITGIRKNIQRVTKEPRIYTKTKTNKKKTVFWNLYKAEHTNESRGHSAGMERA